MKMLVAYDGTLNSREALCFGLAKAKETGARLAVLSVFDSGQFVDYGAGPNAVEAARRQWRANGSTAKERPWLPGSVTVWRSRSTETRADGSSETTAASFA